MSARLEIDRDPENGTELNTGKLYMTSVGEKTAKTIAFTREATQELTPGNFRTQLKFRSRDFSDGAILRVKPGHTTQALIIAGDGIHTDYVVKEIGGSGRFIALPFSRQVVEHSVAASSRFDEISYGENWIYYWVADTNSEGLTVVSLSRSTRSRSREVITPYSEKGGRLPSKFWETYNAQADYVKAKLAQV